MGVGPAYAIPTAVRQAGLSLDDISVFEINEVCRVYVCMYVCKYVCIYVCMFVCMYVRMYVCMYICMHVCMYVHMYNFWIFDPPLLFPSSECQRIV